MEIVRFPLFFRDKVSELASDLCFRTIGGKIPLTSRERIVVSERDKEILSAESRLSFTYDCHKSICCLLLAKVSFIMRGAVPGPKKVVVTLSFYFLETVLKCG